jgi:asparagine synthase (glutamine-hydrolysing)
MCGLAGFVYNAKHTYNQQSILNTMLEHIAHRGSDNRGTFFKSTYVYNLGLGHNRLSIIDTSSRANQPLEFGALTIIFNGEIYNYQELWDTLKQNGYSIDTNSDTEVIIKLFHLYGCRSFSFLNGMFSIVIYDSQNNKLYLIRDRMGVKPLVYYYDEEHIYFSSEIKSFYKGIPMNRNMSINSALLNNYFKFGFINSFDSIFTNIKKVKNGQIVTFDLNNFSKTEEFYWELEKCATKECIDDIEVAYSELKKIVDSSIKYRLVSDVGYGIFLSSGIDSNLVMNVILSNHKKEIYSYTYKGDNSNYNEETANYNKKNVKQNHILISDEQLWDYYKKLCLNYDEPFSDSATVGLYGLAKYAKKTNKVILVGDGGDELLGGYQSYEELYYYTRPSKKMWLARNMYKPFSFILNWIFSRYPLVKRLTKIYFFHTILKYDNLFDIIYTFENRYDPIIEKITKIKNTNQVMDFKNKNSIISFLNYKTKNDLIHQLNYKTDIAGMLETIEIREPLLDFRLFELQQRFSDSMFYDKAKGIGRKHLYLKILSSYNPSLSKLKKKGFKVDLDRVFKKNINEIDELINSHNSENINLEYVRYVWKKYKESNVDFVIMNRILSFIIWEKNLINRI